jgi:hypothetical protein
MVANTVEIISTVGENRSVFDFGISGYEPAWLTGIGPVTAAYTGRLAELAGRTLSSGWLVWDLDDDEWFADAPVVLDFEGTRVEINHWKHDELSLTFNSIDPHQPVRWTGSPFHLAWRDNADPELTALQGARLVRAELLEWAGTDLAQGMVAVGFDFGTTYLTIHNALDENGLCIGRPDHRYRRHPINSVDTHPPSSVD